jgi:hypothetical protein
LEEGIRLGNRTGTPLLIGFELPAGTNTINLTTALPTLADNFNIVGPATQLTIQRNAAAPFRIFKVGPLQQVNISNLTIANGNAPVQTDFPLESQSGGAILNRGTLDLSWVTFQGNQAVGDGGAVWNYSSLSVLACNFYFNSTTNRGGAVFNWGTASIGNDSDIAQNWASSGGAIFNALGGLLTIDGGTQIYTNWAVGGAGVYPGRGGGIANYGTLTMSDLYLGLNTSVAEGGGLFTSGTATLTNVSVLNNQATGANNGKGGGIYVLSGTTTLVSGCTVSGNRAAWEGGGWGICYKAVATLNIDYDLNDIIDDVICEDS